MVGAGFFGGERQGEAQQHRPSYREAEKGEEGARKSKEGVLAEGALTSQLLYW